MLTEIFGFVSVSAMVLCYALESRAPGYVLGFAMSCLLAATYAALIGSWPFAGVESLWSVIAFLRWRRLSLAPGEGGGRL